MIPFGNFSCFSFQSNVSSVIMKKLIIAFILVFLALAGATILTNIQMAKGDVITKVEK